MFRQLQVAAMLVCMISYAMAGTVAIGTASARGDMRVDSYLVKGNATLFDGSVVETGQASADLRLDKGTEIMMSIESRGTLHRSRLVLERGQSVLAANNTFHLEANGLHVTPIEPDSRGVVSLKSGDTVEVAALTGSFGVTDNRGVLLASVRPGRTMSFAMAAAGSAESITAVGMVSYENGQYYLTTVDGTKFELKGKDFKRFVDKKIIVTGTIPGGVTPAPGMSVAISVSSILINGSTAGAISATTGWIIAGTLVGAGTGVGVGLYEANQPGNPASR